MKTLEERKKEFEERYCKQGGRFYDARDILVMNTILEETWQFIESTISQTKQELIEEKRKTEYEILNIFMQFMRNGHNLNKHDLDRIESEWALFEARNYSDLFLEKLSNK